MSATDHARFLRAIGHRVVQTASAWWYDVSPGIYLSFPYHRPAAPEAGEVRRVLGVRGIAARYICPAGSGRASYRVVCDEPGYGLVSLHSKTRNQTRRGLENCTVRQVDFRELESLGGLNLNRDTLLRQGRDIPIDHDEYWRKYYAAAETVPTMEAWAAFAEGQLAAFLIAARIDECMNVLVVRSHRDLLKAYPNNALVFVFTQGALARPGIGEVSFGLEPVQADLDALDHFKQGMGFVKRPIDQRIELSPMLRPVMRGPVLRGLERFASARSDRHCYAKLSGLLRWYAAQKAA